jgi:hypothetical protein
MAGNNAAFIANLRKKEDTKHSINTSPVYNAIAAEANVPFNRITPPADRSVIAPTLAPIAAPTPAPIAAPTPASSQEAPAQASQSQDQDEDAPKGIMVFNDAQINAITGGFAQVVETVRSFETATGSVGGNIATSIDRLGAKIEEASGRQLESMQAITAVMQELKALFVAFSEKPPTPSVSRSRGRVDQAAAPAASAEDADASVSVVELAKPVAVPPVTRKVLPAKIHVLDKTYMGVKIADFSQLKSFTLPPLKSDCANFFHTATLPLNLRTLNVAELEEYRKLSHLELGFSGLPLLEAIATFSTTHKAVTRKLPTNATKMAWIILPPNGTKMSVSDYERGSKPNQSFNTADNYHGGFNTPGIGLMGIIDKDRFSPVLVAVIEENDADGSTSTRIAPVNADGARNLFKHIAHNIAACNEILEKVTHGKLGLDELYCELTAFWTLRAADKSMILIPIIPDNMMESRAVRWFKTPAELKKSRAGAPAADEAEQQEFCETELNAMTSSATPRSKIGSSKPAAVVVIGAPKSGRNSASKSNQGAKAAERRVASISPKSLRTSPHDEDNADEDDQKSSRKRPSSSSSSNGKSQKTSANKNSKVVIDVSSSDESDDLSSSSVVTDDSGEENSDETSSDDNGEDVRSNDDESKSDDDNEDDEDDSNVVPDDDEDEEPRHADKKIKGKTAPVAKKAPPTKSAMKVPAAPSSSSSSSSSSAPQNKRVLIPDDDDDLGDEFTNVTVVQAATPANEFYFVHSSSRGDFYVYFDRKNLWLQNIIQAGKEVRLADIDADQARKYWNRAINHSNDFVRDTLAWLRASADPKHDKKYSDNVYDARGGNFTAIWLYMLLTFSEKPPAEADCYPMKVSLVKTASRFLLENMDGDTDWAKVGMPIFFLPNNEHLEALNKSRGNEVIQTLLKRFTDMEKFKTIIRLPNQQPSARFIVFIDLVLLKK